MGHTLYLIVMVLLAATLLGFVIVLTRRARREGLPPRHYLDVGVAGATYSVLAFVLFLLLLVFLLLQVFGH